MKKSHHNGVILLTIETNVGLNSIKNYGKILMRERFSMCP
ncbi:hypothetical protein RICGR_1239 [Rickettsiella grylli]|uniref:Uncharacterized protein n=1 Tax=Rickettsiella grylli TaxID=59196 RepID=A8PP97_9COXI|nr:hypothetical protein RICGR_1239 [Rickettsiella grylli]